MIEMDRNGRQLARRGRCHSRSRRCFPRSTSTTRTSLISGVIDSTNAWKKMTVITMEMSQVLRPKSGRRQCLYPERGGPRAAALDAVLHIMFIRRAQSSTTLRDTCAVLSILLWSLGRKILAWCYRSFGYSCQLCFSRAVTLRAGVAKSVQSRPHGV